MEEMGIGLEQKKEEEKNISRLNNEIEQLKLQNEGLLESNLLIQNRIDELMNSDSDFDNLLLNAEMGALYIDKDMKIRKVTPIIEMMTGISASDIGKYVLNITFMPAYPGFPYDLITAYEQEQMIEQEVNDMHNMIWLVRIRPYYSREGTVNGLLVTMFDVTKRLEASKYELKLLMDNIPGGVAKMRYEHGLIIEYANRGLYQIIQCSKDDFARDHNNFYDSIILLPDWRLMQQEIERCIVDWKPLDMEYRVRNQDGRVGWQMITAAPIQQDGKVMLQCSISDITRIKETERQLDSLVENFPGGILRVFYNGDQPRMEYISEVATKITGATLEMFRKLEQDKTGIATFGDAWKVAKESMDKAFYEGRGFRYEHLITRPDGKKRWAEFRSSVVSRSESGVLIQYVVMDITEQKQNEERLKRERERMDIVAGLSTDAIFEYDILEDRIQYYSKNKEFFASEYGMPVIEHYTERILNGNRGDSMIHPDDYDKFVDLCNQFRLGVDNIYCEIRKLVKPKKYLWIAVEAKSIKDENKNVSMVVGKISNIEERKQREELLRIQSERDPLTTLYNSKVVRTIITDKLKKRGLDQTFLIIADIDDFKTVNDTMGHLYGDAVICTFADALRFYFSNMVIGRIGGDEFLIYVDNLTKKQIEEIIKELIFKLSRIYSDGEDHTTISASFGLVECKGKDSLEELINKADSALYFLKKHTKGGIMEYREGMLMGDTALSGEDTNNYVPEALIHTENDLIVFALELFERVKDTKGAIRILADAICRFFYIQDIVYLHKTGKTSAKMEFHWGGTDTQQFYDKVMDVSGEDWVRLFHQLGQDHNFTLTEQDSTTDNTSKAKSILSISLIEHKEEGFMLFIDKHKERVWQSEKAVLERLANIIFKRLVEIERQKSQEEYNQYIASHDKMTGLPNYTYFLSYCEQYVNEHKDKEFALVFSDFRNFHYLNEVYGYMTGDQILQQFSRVLSRGKGVITARVMADRFVTMFETDNLEKLKEDFLNRTNKFCNEINAKYDQCKLVSVGGIAKVDRSLESFTISVDNANVARKIAKEDNHYHMVIYNDDLRKTLMQHMEIISNMAEALEHKEFKLYLQPKINIETEEIVGAEALVRWVKEDGTVMGPDSFIPIFEKTGFITQVDFEILRQVLELQHNLLQQGKTAPVISVNFSRRHQENPEYINNIDALIRQYQVPTSNLEIEITESVFMYDLAPLSASIQELRDRGIAVSIDDFGAGYSSLNVLAKVDVDVVKLDRQFILDVEAERGKDTLVFMSLLVNMIKHLGFKVIAEGVETKEQVELLKKAGCQYAQGYYYAKPLPVDEFLEYIKII